MLLDLLLAGDLVRQRPQLALQYQVGGVGDVLLQRQKQPEGPAPSGQILILALLKFLTFNVPRGHDTGSTGICGACFSLLQSSPCPS